MSLEILGNKWKHTVLELDFSLLIKQMWVLGRDLATLLHI